MQHLKQKLLHILEANAIFTTAVIHLDSYALQNSGSHSLNARGMQIGADTGLHRSLAFY